MHPIPAHARPLGRGDLARLSYELGRSRATGVFTVYAAGRLPEVMVLRRGHLLAREIDALGRQTARRLEQLAGLAAAHYTFDSDAGVCPPGAVERQFSLASWARSHFEAQLDAGQAQILVVELTGVRLRVARQHLPDPGLCDATDLRIVEALASPLRLDQLWHHARTPRFRLLSFLHFLRCVGALEVEDVAAAPPPQPNRAAAQDRTALSHESARKLLGVSADADRVQVKRAYRRLVRAVHPDLQPEAGQARRRALERKLAAITEAYSRLVG